MYTLRIIEQKKGLETRSNFFLGKNYFVYYRCPLDEKEFIKEGAESLFEKKLKDSVGVDALKVMLTDDVIGFVESDKNNATLFYKDQSAYIVNDDGKTFERIYGKYDKQ